MQDIAALLSLNEPPELQTWREQVRAFTTKNLPKDIASKSARGLKIVKDDYVRWQKVLRHNGWFAGLWPKEYGGQGWTALRQLVLAQESALCNAPMLIPYGVSMVGPVLYTYGTEEQKRVHLPGILSSDVWWCQGYSEPGAGSDLASLKTSAVREGDHYVVNGAKMWTTEAHWADMMHCLVRTSREGKPQTGITFLLVDMKSPGLEIRPIVTIDGIHHTNALFFDNVRVPAGNRVGEEGQGWSIAKFLLGNERVSIADTGPKLRLFRRVQSLLADALKRTDVPEGLKPLLTARVADVGIQLLALCALERECVGAWSKGAPGAADASALKIRGTEVLQFMTEVALQLQGAVGAIHDSECLYEDPAAPPTIAEEASALAHEYLYGRCWSIFGGTNEVQRNIIAKHVLGG